MSVSWDKMKPATLSEADATFERDRLLVRWGQAKTALVAAKELETDLRKQVSSALFPAPDEGTQRVELGNGYRAKLVQKFIYKLDRDTDKIDNALDKIEKIGNEGAFIAKRLIKWTPSLSLPEYRDLEPQYRAVIDEVMTVEAADPILAIEESKVRK